MNTHGIEAIHLVTQYLAAAGISFLAKQDDDSHTNLGFSTKNKRFETWKLNNNGDYLALDLVSFSLNWLSIDGDSTFLLDSRSHIEIVHWISNTAAAHGITKPYNYDFHYSLPYGIQGDFQFKKEKIVLDKEISVRTLAHEVLSEVLESNELRSDIRTWPHHFDTGAFAVLPAKKSVSVGMGMAIPDSVLNDYYFYIRGYKGHNALDTTNFQPLVHGDWIQKGFEGAVLALNEFGKKTALEFFNAAISTYSK